MNGGPRYSEEDARAAVAASRSYAEALRRLGMCATGGNWRTLKRYVIDVWQIPVAHFDPHASSRAALAINRWQPRPLAEVLVEGSSFSRVQLKKRLYAEGLKARRCEVCGQGEEWRGRRMSLILDHINGVRDDHRLENLRVLCPNCAATLDTHCGRNVQHTRACATCGAQFTPAGSKQRHCSHRCGSLSPASVAAHAARRQIERPPYEVLLAELAATSWSAAGPEVRRERQRRPEVGEGVRAGAGGRPGGPGGLRQRPHRARPSLLGSRLAIYLGAVWASIIDFIVTALMLLSVRVFVTMLALAVVGTIVMLVW